MNSAAQRRIRKLRFKTTERQIAKNGAIINTLGKSARQTRRFRQKLVRKKLKQKGIAV